MVTSNNRGKGLEYNELIRPPSHRLARIAPVTVYDTRTGVFPRQRNGALPILENFVGGITIYYCTLHRVRKGQKPA